MKTRNRYTSEDKGLHFYRQNRSKEEWRPNSMWSLHCRLYNILCRRLYGRIRPIWELNGNLSPATEQCVS
jgi:hypothetical protein